MPFWSQDLGILPLAPTLESSLTPLACQVRTQEEPASSNPKAAKNAGQPCSCSIVVVLVRTSFIHTNLVRTPVHFHAVFCLGLPW